MEFGMSCGVREGVRRGRTGADGSDGRWLSFAGSLLPPSAAHVSLAPYELTDWCQSVAPSRAPQNTLSKPNSIVRTIQELKFSVVDKDDKIYFSYFWKSWGNLLGMRPFRVVDGRRDQMSGLDVSVRRRLHIFHRHLLCQALTDFFYYAHFLQLESTSVITYLLWRQKEVR